MMHRLFFLILLLLFSLQMHAAETLHIAVINLEPFLTDEGKGKTPGGIAVDYWRDYIAPRMNVSVKFSGPYPIRRAEYMLKNGEVDAVMHLTKIPEREKDFLFPETHLTGIKSCLVVPVDSSITKVLKTEDMYGWTILFIDSAYVPEMLLHRRINIEKVSGTDFRHIQLNMLLASRGEAMLDINQVSLLFYLRNRGYLDRVRIITLPVKPQKVYTIFSKTAKGMDLKRRFDKVNSKGLKKGVFERMTQDYLKRSGLANRNAVK
ncbi:MAG TPA: transporter substrate-binding domain-containing protein [Spirochaetota bacterium]|nr:transporter substrate-binding domain-containing protein [Spirochaetota bacterium]